MKQRIRTVGIIRKNDEILLLKRIQNRVDEDTLWELPTGKIQFGEQPEEAMSRTIFEYLGVHAVEVKLRDVVTFIAPEGASQLRNLYIIYDIKLGEKEKISPAGRYSSYKTLKPSEFASLRIDSASASVLTLEENSNATIDYRDVANAATVFVDGASKGNPGPSAIGYYIIDENGKVLSQGGEFIGFASSRVAEYSSLKLGVEQAISLGLKSVRFVSDNLMMVNQMNGIYQIKNKDLIPYYKEIQNLLPQFDAYAFVHVHREQNSHADFEANKAIKKHFAK